MSTSYTLNNLGKVSVALLINAASLRGVTCVVTDCHNDSVLLSSQHHSSHYLPELSSRSTFHSFWIQLCKKKQQQKYFQQLLRQKKENTQLLFNAFGVTEKYRVFPQMFVETLGSGGVLERLSKDRQWTTVFSVFLDDGQRERALQ